jgi:3',5'-cyclic-AMP phosphodiesterase
VNALTGGGDASRPFLLAQLSDLHIKADGELSYGVVDTAAMLRACVQHLLERPRQPDAIAITGDLTDGGRPEEYATLRELLAPLPMPVYVIPGNHDHRAAMRVAFSDHAYLDGTGAYLHYAIETHPLRIVALDTVIAGASEGELCEERLEWLTRTLSAEPERPTVVLMHHPPFTTFIGHMDVLGLRDPHRLTTVIERHPQVAAILCGHVHRPIETRYAGTIAFIAPSTAHQIVLDLDRNAPSRFVMEPPAYRLHAYASGAGLVSHTAYVGNYAGPYSFRGDGEM